VGGVRTWASSLLLHIPAPIRSLRRIPVLGDIIHRVSYFAVPGDRMVWGQVQFGPAQGLWIEVHPRTGQFYLAGNAELLTQSVISQHLRPGDVFYDLGANIGLFSLLAARCVGPTGRVISFEPDPLVAARLRRNIARNGFSNVTVIEAGIWSTSGNFAFAPATSASPDRGVGTFMATGNISDRTLIRCYSLDDFIRVAPPPDAIKCDVEGAELEALRGAENLLTTHPPWILCETHSEANNRAACDILSHFGYTFETEDGYHILAERKTEH
jgi:FkbM family methyltransferase